MASSAPTPAERAIAAAFYAPIGLGAQLVDNFPETVNKARQQIVLARFIGKMAVDQGASELRRRLAPRPPRSKGFTPSQRDNNNTLVANMQQLANAA